MSSSRFPAASSRHLFVAQHSGVGGNGMARKPLPCFSDADLDKNFLKLFMQKLYAFGEKLIILIEKSQ